MHVFIRIRKLYVERCGAKGERILPLRRRGECMVGTGMDGKEESSVE